MEFFIIIHLTKVQQKSPQAFAKKVRVTMAQTFNIFFIQHIYEDATLTLS